MRLARLDLIRYGRFTDASFDLPRSGRDLHIIFGPNEAGKTTSLTAIEDLLFGIPTRSPYNFLHDYDALRLGAILENGANRLEFRRRKGTRETILGPDGLPLNGDEALLAPFLGGADRAFFDRMFNLSHERLAEGGKAILAAEDDVGQMLFSASTGLSDLRTRLKQLEVEADGLWGPRRSERRLYHQAEARLEEAARQQRDHTLSANAWLAASKTLEDAEKVHRDIRQRHETVSIELKKLARIRRVYAYVRRRRELDTEIAAVSDIAALPENAAILVADAEKHEVEARTRIETLSSQSESAQQQLQALTFDAALMQRADEIKVLHERRIAIRSERGDLPKRRAELESELRELSMLAVELGWEAGESTTILDRIPVKGSVTRLRALVTRRGELLAVLEASSKTANETRATLDDKKSRVDEFGEVMPNIKLTAALSAVRDSGDVMARIRAAQGSVQTASERIERLTKSLKPALADDADLSILTVPPRTVVEAHQDSVQDWMRRQREANRSLEEARQALEREQKAVERRVRDEGLVTLNALEDARSYRDTLWGFVHLQYVLDSSIPPEVAGAHATALKDLPDSFKSAVWEADAVADRRFEKAEESGRLAELARNIADRSVTIEQLEAQQTLLKDEGTRLDEVWRALWAKTPIEVLTPEAMLVWLDVRDSIIEAAERQRDAQRELDALRVEERDARSQIVTALTSSGIETADMETDTLRVVMEHAEAVQRQREAQAKQLQEMQEAARTAQADLSRRARELEKAEADWTAWQEHWAAALGDAGLKAETAPEVVSDQIDTIDEMRERASRAKQLQEKRIGAIERDIAEFELTVESVIAELAPDLRGVLVDDAVLKLESRLSEVQEKHKQHKELSSAVAIRTKQIEKLEEDWKAAWASVQPLKQAVGVDEIEQLKAAIARSDRLRAVKRELSDVAEVLKQQGDGLALDDLQRECRDVDIDQVRTREESAESELKVLQEQLTEAVERRTEARRAFQAIGSDDSAAQSAAVRQEALASMQEAAERYLRVRTSVVLLRWAIDRYRREKQGPLLDRAGKLFRTLTRGSFSRLGVDFDERDQMYLTGIRPNGQVVAVGGLSSGTEDQLFLALRIAAVEDYLDKAVALPFVADDLFINFDPERSAAGFQVLGELAEKTQVLFFTHHPHLVDVARETFGSAVSIVSLVDQHQSRVA